MARLSNLYASQPVASAPRRGGGGGGGGNTANRPRRPNRPSGAGGGGGGGSKLPNGGLYTGDQGEALTNQDPLAYFTNLLGAAGQSDYSGTPYGEYVNKTRLDELMRQYGVAQAGNQQLSPVDFALNQYGAGWTNGPAQAGGGAGGGSGVNTAPVHTMGGGGGGGKHHHNGNGNGGGGGNSPQGPATFNPGTLPSTTVDSYNQWFSNTDPLSYLHTNQAAGGGRIEGGGNADFQQYQDDVFNPGVQSQLEAARVAQGKPTLSLDDFVQGRDLVNEARNSYAFRPNARRLPGPLNLSGRYSWWS